MGAVKTSSREYPKKYFASKAHEFLTKEKRCGFIVLETLKKIVNGAEVPNSDNQNKPQSILALTWFDKVPKSIISTTGSCDASNPREPDRHTWLPMVMVSCARNVPSWKYLDLR